MPENTPGPGRKAKAGPRPKHVPRRTCVVCRDQDAKRSLTRIVRQPDGTVVVDGTGKLNGRGAYICERDRCWDVATDGPVLAKALRIEIDDTTRDRLRAHRQGRPGSATREGMHD